MDELEDEIRAQAHHWRTLRDEGLSQEDQRRFEQWRDADPRHAEAYAEARVFWEAAGLPGLGGKITATMARQESEELQTAGGEVSQFRQSIVPRFVAGALAAAAAVAAFIAVGPDLSSFGEPSVRTERFATELGSTQVLTLPDRTRITLGPDSVLEIALSDSQRNAQLLKGSAFFNVHSIQQRPFIVGTDIIDVAVTGTKFDVQLRDENAAVAVGEGSVEVRLSGSDDEVGALGSPIRLEGGQRVSASLADGFGEVEEVFPAELAAWRTGRMIFSNATLVEVASELNRYVAKPISVDPSVSGLKISGTFDSAQADELLEFIQRSYPVRVIEANAERQIVPR
ncbi:MAG: FecR domain-containing protein [Pseudomonadota bacterium]